MTTGYAGDVGGLGETEYAKWHPAWSGDSALLWCCWGLGRRRCSFQGLGGVSSLGGRRAPSWPSWICSHRVGAIQADVGGRRRRCCWFGAGGTQGFADKAAMIHGLDIEQCEPDSLDGLLHIVHQCALASVRHPACRHWDRILQPGLHMRQQVEGSNEEGRVLGVERRSAWPVPFGEGLAQQPDGAHLLDQPEHPVPQLANATGGNLHC